MSEETEVKSTEEVGNKIPRKEGPGQEEAPPERQA